MNLNRDSKDHYPPPRAPSLNDRSKVSATTEQRSSTPLSLTQKESPGPDVNSKALEAGMAVLPKEKVDLDLILIDWEGPNDPENPKNWSFKKKWAATAIISAFNFISPVSSAIIAPAADQIAQQFAITSTVVIAMVVSIFLLAYAIGPLFFGPLSEIYGRSRILQAANILYLMWNLACGFAQNPSQLIAFRFLAGLGGSASLSIGGGVLGDCWRTHERGKAIALYSLAPLLGPVIGPVAGAWIVEKSTWRWFWSTTISGSVVQILGFLFLQETFAPLILERKANKIKKQMRLERHEGQHCIRTPFQSDERRWKSIFTKAIIRPFVLFSHEPIIQLLGTYLAFVYGLIYLTATTIPTIFKVTYQESVGIAGLHYIALGFGLSAASQVNARMLDRVYVYFKSKNGGIGKPEFRLPSMIPGTIFIPAGLLITGWSAQNHVHWIILDIGIALIGAGLILNIQSIQTYVVDAFTLHAASALASVSCLRSLAGFGFPLFAPAMYNALGYGNGNTVLAAFAIAIGCPAPWLFWHFGERIRNRSKYAANT